MFIKTVMMAKYVKKLITELNADIYLLQEATAKSKQDFTVNYEFNFKKSGGSRIYGEAIVYNKTTLDMSTASFKTGFLPNKTNLDGYKAYVIMEYAQFIILCIHLDVHDKTGDTRVRQIKYILDTLLKNYKNRPIIIGGDFNAHIKNRLYSHTNTAVQDPGVST